MQRFLLIQLSFLLCVGGALGATLVSGDQTGTWTLAGSPYELVGDVRIPAGQALKIEPGVTVQGRPTFRITVEGRLVAAGTAGQPILMTATDTSAGWRGLRILAADDATLLSHCIIEYAKGTGAYPDVQGGAVLVRNCSPTIEYCELRYSSSKNSNANGTGGGVSTESSNAVIRANYIHDNNADSGGGICTMEYGTPWIYNNLIERNQGSYAGGGLYLGARSSPLIENNVIQDNVAGGWGGGGINSWTSFIYYNTYPTIMNNLIVRNRTSSGGNANGGGGVYCRYDRAVLVNNTIADNQAGDGGGICCVNYPQQAPLVSNCILWGNTATHGPQVYLYPDTQSAIQISYSDVAGGYSGTGNIDADPLLESDYRLGFKSPCIDQGEPAYVPAAGERDIDGERRVWDGNGDGIERVDMGADEYGSYRFGDMNCDGAVDFGDVNPFVLALSDPAGYAALYPECAASNADVNEDGVVDFGDINAFVALLSHA